MQAQTSLAKLYHKGRGVEQDIIEAYRWYDIAAQLGDSNAKFERDEVARNMPSEQVAAAQLVAAQWLSENSGAATNAEGID